MGWLFVKHLRPFVLLAGAASLLLNLALLMPVDLYDAGVRPRVRQPQHGDAGDAELRWRCLALALGYCMDVVRARALAWAGRALDRRLSPAALAAVLRGRPVSLAAPNTDALRDIAQLRAFLSGSGIQALFDAPWLPLYLLVIGLMHPLLGAAAARRRCPALRSGRADRTADAGRRRARAALLARHQPSRRGARRAMRK